MKPRHGHVVLAVASILTCCSRGATALPWPDAAPSVTGKSNAPDSVPKYVLDYAPLVWLYSKEQYLPSDIGAQLVNTTPKQNRNNLTSIPSPLNLDNLDQLNRFGANGTDIYLQSNQDAAKDPKWLYGVLPDADGKAQEVTSNVIITVDKGKGVVDAFYFYFFAFNWGGVTLERIFGNHVGDWEHNMVRFVNGVPDVVFYSQHAAGQTFKYKDLHKDKSGIRPISYCAQGGHAVYATSGIHNHDDGDNVLSTAGLVNDYTDEGHIWDPIQSAYWYKMSPVSGTTPATSGSGTPVATTHQNEPSTRDTAALGIFTPYDGHSPVGFLYFKGRWGDYQFADDDSRQEKLEILPFKFYKWVSGPEGPAFKNLGRKNPWQADHGRVLDSI